MVSNDPKTIQDRLGSVSTLCVCTLLVSGPRQAPQHCNHSTVLHGPTSLAPTNEESAWLAEETLWEKKPRMSGMNVY